MTFEKPRTQTRIQSKRSQHSPSDRRTPGEQTPNTMTTWLERQASNRYVQFGAVALISGATVAATIYGVQTVRRKERIDELKASIPELSENHRADLVFLAPLSQPPLELCSCQRPLP